MTCPVCRAVFGPGQERCPACGSVVSPRTEGALAPKAEPLREIPTFKKKDKTWKDEVRDRVRTRKRQKSGDAPELPLFRGTEAESVPTERVDDEPDADPTQGDEEADRLDTLAPDPYAVTERVAPGLLQEDEPVADLPLRPVDADAGAERAAVSAPAAAPAPAVSGFGDRVFELDEPAPFEREGARWPSEERIAPVDGLQPVERPARFGERLQAGAVDALLLAALWSVVVYFASRAAHVAVAGLLPVWPSLVAYLALLGLLYAAYFTGTTGQTLGKIVSGLRVVDTAGRPPGYARALLRAAVAVPGILLLCAGVAPMFFDPARRALHDRLFRTRVVKG